MFTLLGCVLDIVIIIILSRKKFYVEVKQKN